MLSNWRSFLELQHFIILMSPLNQSSEILISFHYLITTILLDCSWATRCLHSFYISKRRIFPTYPFADFFKPVFARAIRRLWIVRIRCKLFCRYYIKSYFNSFFIWIDSRYNLNPRIKHGRIILLELETKLFFW